ncbi:putative RING-H2 finger protein ATL21B [Prunus yedoensis var. nudiflora]|uniref:RING-type E3 ubiquitin transferase n=1 Tax=Prunus yedoensis var. nudiflora TaxID=2094558 RepID=A0A314Z9Q8_PRUYE|nr:putative RING-H2 finger protein ATL21B [Prunus yedoensis var. nudiflora]
MIDYVINLALMLGSWSHSNRPVMAIATQNVGLVDHRVSLWFTPYMENIKIFTLFILFLFLLFLPHTAVTKTTCGSSTCTTGGPLGLISHVTTTVKPFSLSHLLGTSLSKASDYNGQVVTINDPDKCLPARLLNQETSLVEYSPFSYLSFGGPMNYTFLNCSSSKPSILPARIISCLSTAYYKVIALPTSWLLPPDPILLPHCNEISTTLVPTSLEWEHFNDGLELTWEVPDCRSCEVRGQACGLKNGKSLEIRCFGPSKIHTVRASSGPSRAAKYGVMMAIGIAPLLFIIWLVLYVCGRMMIEVNGQNHRHITELSIVTNQQLPTIVTGLDASTIESYPTTLLGESWEPPKPNDNTCPICLSEYQSKETLRTIPECNHYFHANCVDKWLRLNATCPLCRNPRDRDNNISHLVIEI